MACRRRTFWGCSDEKMPSARFPARLDERHAVDGERHIDPDARTIRPGADGPNPVTSVAAWTPCLRKTSAAAAFDWTVRDRRHHPARLSLAACRPPAVPVLIGL
jgi:hypothetical protein